MPANCVTWPMARGRFGARKPLQRGCEGIACNRAGTERGEVIGFHLAVNYAEFALMKETAQMGEGNF